MKFLESYNGYISENKFGFGSNNSVNVDSSYIKNYGEQFPMDRVNIGDIITYKGTDYFVIVNKDEMMQLSVDPNSQPWTDPNKFIQDTGNRKIDNSVEFNNKVCIRKES